MKRSAWVGVVVVLLAGLVLLAGCQSSGSTTDGAPGGATKSDQAPAGGGANNDGAAAKSAKIAMANFAFSPASVTVTAGGKVTWTNTDSVQHTVTADDGSFDSGLLSQGRSFTRAFSRAGTVKFHCSPHPDMTGTITVK